MEVCNAHPKAGKTAALYVGKIAKGLLRALKERFLNVKKNTVQAEVTKFNSMKITSKQKGDLLNVGILGDVSLFLNSRTQEII